MRRQVDQDRRWAGIGAGEWPKVVIIILNWNGWKDTIECLNSLLKIEYPNYQIMILDNGSTDGSLQKIRSWALGETALKSALIEADLNSNPSRWTDPGQAPVQSGGSVDGKERPIAGQSRLILFQSKENLGFAAGNNAIIPFALMDPAAKYIWLLNNDTTIPAGSLSALVKDLMIDSGLGIISPKICYYSDPERIWFAGGRLRLIRATGSNMGLGMKDGDSYRGILPCTFITGCAMLLKREVFESIGLFDPLYFLYGEDVDLSMRAINAGWRLAADLDTVVYHKVSSAVGGDPLPLQTYYLSRNRPYFSAKHHNNWQKMVFNLFWFSSRTAKLLSWIMNGRIDLARAAIRGYTDYRRGRMGRS